MCPLIKTSILIKCRNEQKSVIRLFVASMFLTENLLPFFLILLMLLLVIEKTLCVIVFFSPNNVACDVTENYVLLKSYYLLNKIHVVGTVVYLFLQKKNIVILA